MSRKDILPDLVRDSRIETSVSGDTTKHIFYEPGRTPEERRRCRVELWDRDGTLGSGAYGTVYRERRQGSSGTVDGFRAVKQINKFMLKSEQLDYTRELEAIIKFSHRNYSHCFVRSDGWFETEDSVFISMEYVEAGDLQKYLVRPLPEAEVQQVVKQVLEGIGFMHDNGFVHRDLKPKNIMVAAKGPKWFVKITDFGISKRRKKGVTTLRTLKRGTLGFAAPEVLDLLESSGEKAGSYSFAVDIWSLGALAYYMLTNRMAFESLGETARYALGGDFPIGQLKDIQASEKFQDFAKQMLSRKPEVRPTAVTAAAHEWLTTPLTGEKPQTTEYTEHWNGATNLSAASGSWETEVIEARPKEEPPKYQRPTAQTAKFDSTLRWVDKLPSDHRYVLDEALVTTRSGDNTLRPLDKQHSGHPHVSDEPTPRKKHSHPVDKQPPGHTYASDRASPLTSIIRVATPDTPENVREAIKSLEQSLQTREDSSQSEYESDETQTTSSLSRTPRVVKPSRRLPPAQSQKTAAFAPYITQAFHTRRSMPQQDKKSFYKSDQGFSNPYGDEYQQSNYFEDAKANKTRWCIRPVSAGVHYCDELGNLWPSLDFRPESIPRFKSFEEEDNFWSLYERSGMVRRLLCSNEVIAGDRQRPALPVRCFSCYVEVRPLFHARCGHWHCLRCLAWHNSNVTGIATPPPLECSWPVRLIRRLDPAKARTAQLMKRSTRPIRCPNRQCLFTFEPDYIALDFKTTEWVMYCPNCSREICILCAEADGDIAYWHPNCPARSADWLMPYYPQRHPLPEQPLVVHSEQSQLKALREASPDPFRTTAEDPWQHISSLPVDGYSNCRQCGVTLSGLRKGDTLQPLKCLHTMCTSCILQWFTLGLVVPTVAGYLCYLCPQRSAATNTSLGTDGLRLMDSLGLGPAWKELWELNMRLGQSQSWVCPYYHATPVLCPSGKYLPLRIYCRTCGVKYCRWCGLVLPDGVKCPNNRLLEEFVQSLAAEGKLTDPKIRVVLAQALEIPL